MVAGVGVLMTWHVRLISRGETSIEQHINKETKSKFARENRNFVNPYDFGVVENWRIFLGVDYRLGSVFRRLILPSAHKPEEDGLNFRTNFCGFQQCDTKSNAVDLKLNSVLIEKV